MELIGNHLQVFISLVVILGAAAVALVCDLLKRNNEHLRELNTELRVRREEEQRRSELMLQTVTIQQPAALTEAPAAAALPAPAAAERLTAIQAAPAMERAAEVTSRRGVKRAEPAAETQPAVQPGASLAEARMLAREFMGRAAERARAEQPAASNPTVREPEVIVEQPVASTSQNASKPARKDWSKILSATKRPANFEAAAEAAPKQKLGELIPFESIQNSSEELQVPAGFHEGMMLARILNGDKVVRGLVVVIGINDFSVRKQEGGELGAEALVGSVSDHIRSILRPGDFACQSNQEEFLMICPNDREAASQRRLGEIAESLWDYQLRTVGTSPILFSWGGVEAKGESFASVLSAAAERMRETRRSRRSLAIEAPARKAV